MATTSHRAPLLVTLIILLGVGGRWMRGAQGAPKDPPVARAALDSQLAAVDRAGRGAREKKGRKAPRPPSESRRRTRRPQPAQGDAPTEAGPATGGVGTVRTERTPPSVVDPRAMARYRADQARADGENRPDGSRRASKARRGRAGPDTRPPLVDVETASAAELERLPRVGPSLARRIVEDRAARGPFRSLDGLQRVRGIGPAMARQLQGYVTFGATGRP